MWNIFCFLRCQFMLCIFGFNHLIFLYFQLILHFTHLCYMTARTSTWNHITKVKNQIDWFQKTEIFLMHKNHLKYLFISTYHTSTERNSMDKSNFWPWDRNFEISKFAWTCSLTIFYCYRIIVRGMFISRVIALCHGTYQTIIWLFRVCECACGVRVSYILRHPW